MLPDGSASTGTKPTRALKDDIVYEVHVRGLTENDPAIPAADRGTYKGAGLKAASLAALGVTAVEFLPVQETQNDANDVDPTGTDGDNYWGYSTLDYFAPDRRYAADKSAGGPTREFKAMVKAYHDAGDQGLHRCRLQPHRRGRSLELRRQQHLQPVLAAAAWTTRPTTS